MHTTAESPQQEIPQITNCGLKASEQNMHEIRPCPDSHCSRRVSSLLCFSFAAVRFPCEAHPKKQELRSDQHAAQSNPAQPGTSRTRIESRGSPHPRRQTDKTRPYPLLLRVARGGRRCGRCGVAVSHLAGGGAWAGGRSGPAGLVDERAWGAIEEAEKTLKSDAAGERRERGKARTDSGRMDG